MNLEDIVGGAVLSLAAHACPGAHQVGHVRRDDAAGLEHARVEQHGAEVVALGGDVIAIRGRGQVLTEIEGWSDEEQGL